MDLDDKKLTMENDSKPVVLCFSGNDPSGGAGIQADIESISSQGCHAAPIITVLTGQDTLNVFSVISIDPSLVIEQARTILEDMHVEVFKIGLLGSVEIIEAVHSIIVDYPDKQVVLDPVLSSGQGTDISDENSIDAMVSLLLPLTTIITPNTLESRRLVPEADDADARAMGLLDKGCEFALVTGTHASTPNVTNTLYGNRQILKSWQWQRLPDSYHGSGCTLASSLAALMAQGLTPQSACHEAQDYTWQSLKYGFRVGMGQLLPNRFYWATEDDDDLENGLKLN